MKAPQHGDLDLDVIVVSGVFLPGKNHRTGNVGSEPPVVIRLAAQWLDRVVRHAYNAEKSTAVLHK